MQSVSIKPPLIQYAAQQNDQKKEADVAIASGLDPSMIPKRDYDKMLNAENIDDSAAFLEQSENGNEAQMDDDQNEKQIKLSTNIDAIPQRDYDSMLKQTEIETNADMEQKELIEQLTKQMIQAADDPHTDKAQYRSITAVIPQRNYDQMIQKQTSAVVETKDNAQKAPVVTTKDGKWVCPSETCDHLNKSTRNNCSVCHTLKPSYKRTAALLDDSIDQLGLENRWVCKACNGLNKGSRQSCVFCHQVKSYQPKSKTAAKQAVESSKKKKTIFEDMERWVCPNEECNFLNKGSRIKCQVCHTQRKDHCAIIGDKAATHIDKNEEVENATNESKNEKTKAYAHPLEARMMGMNVGTANVTEWSCPICTFLNKSSKCEMCGCPKDAK